MLMLFCILLQARCWDDEVAETSAADLKTAALAADVCLTQPMQRAVVVTLDQARTCRFFHAKLGMHCILI